MGDSVHLSVIEAYGVKAAKIGLYDLLSGKNRSQNWGKKQSLKHEMGKARKEHITSTEDAYKTIRTAQNASHFARTGLNDDSSRGHTVFIAHVRRGKQTTYFLFVDCAGSEG